jgi:hypothetical protein
MKAKLYIIILAICSALAGCGKEATPAQQEIVEQLIQEQLDVPYEEPSWNLAEDRLLESGETVEEAAERNRKLYADARNYLLALKNKPYKEKINWAVRTLELEIDLLERTQKASVEPVDGLAAMIKQRKKWLTTLKD